MDNYITEQIKDRWEEIMPSLTYNAIERVNGKRSWVCPKCGHGKNGDGMTMNPKSKNYGNLKCHGCGWNGSIIDLYMQEKSIDLTQAISELSEQLGIDRAAEQVKPMPKSVKQEQTEEDYTDFFLQAHKDIDKTDYHRGLSRETLDRFNIGYVADWRLPKEAYLRNGEGRTEKKWEGIPKTPRLIIPTGKSSYLARLVGDGKIPKQKVGSANILNVDCIGKTDRPIFVTEGEIDALSIIDCGAEAIGLGSVAYIDKFIRVVRELKPTQQFIICLDSDSSGREASKKIMSELNKLNIKAQDYSAEILGGYKDASEALQKNREVFKANIEQISNIATATAKEELKDLISSENVLSNMGSFMEYIKTDSKNRVIPTGFKNIDSVMQGGLISGLYVVGAVSSLGKTTFLLQVADNIAKQGRDVIFFSLEMARAEIMAKSLSRLSYEVSREQIGDKRYAKTALSLLKGSDYKWYSNEEKYCIEQAEKKYRKYAEHLYVVEGLGNIGVKEVGERIQRHIDATGQKPIVIIDYLQILSPVDSRLSDKQAVDKNILELKRLSRDYDIPIVCISSFNRGSYTEAVTLSAFKESGAIEYGSDVLIALQYNGMEDSKKDDDTRRLIKDQEEKGRSGEAQDIQVKFLKQRKASKGSTLFKFYPMFNYFEETDATEEQEKPKRRVF